MLRRVTSLVVSFSVLGVLFAQPAASDDDDEIDLPGVERLVKDLGSVDFRRRDAAMNRLRKVGDLAIPVLERVKDSPDLEMRRRVAELLATIKITGELFCYGGYERGIISVAMLPGDKRALTAGEDRTIRLLDLEQGGEIRRFDGHSKQVWALAVGADGKFVSGGQDACIRAWSIDGYAKSRQLAELPDSVRCLAFARGGKQLLAGAFDTNVHVLNAQTGKSEAIWTGHSDAVMSLAVSPDGRTVLSSGGYRDQSVCVRDADTGEIRRRLVGHRYHVCAVAFVDDRHAVSAGYDNTIRFWNLETGKIEREFHGHQNGVYGLAVSRDGKRLLSGGYDKLIRLWDIATGETLRRFQQHEDGVNAVAFTSNGRYALSASNDRTARLLYLPRVAK
jgi:WD40 repeat protein